MDIFRGTMILSTTDSILTLLSFEFLLCFFFFFKNKCVFDLYYQCLAPSRYTVGLLNIEIIKGMADILIHVYQNKE